MRKNKTMLQKKKRLASFVRLVEDSAHHGEVNTCPVCCDSRGSTFSLTAARKPQAKQTKPFPSAKCASRLLACLHNTSHFGITGNIKRDPEMSQNRQGNVMFTVTASRQRRCH
jgi:hypothetical protein